MKGRGFDLFKGNIIFLFMLNILRHIILFPIYAVQAAICYATIPRLPEPIGDRMMRMGQGKPLRLLVIGDSSAAGVGAQSQDEVLLGHLTRDLSRDWDVTCTLWAKSGATLATTLAMLDDMPPEEFDIAFVTLGLNDVKNGVRFQAWVADYTRLLKRLRRRHKVPRVIVSGLAPIRLFPALPTPLKHMLGDRAEWFDTALESLVAATPHAEYLPLDLEMDVTKMSVDGFHPGPEIYAEWARRVIRAIRSDAAPKKEPAPSQDDHGGLGAT